MKIDRVVLGILAIIAGILILGHWLSVTLIAGIFLIIFGVLTLVRRA